MPTSLGLPAPAISADGQDTTNSTGASRAIPPLVCVLLRVFFVYSLYLDKAWQGCVFTFSRSSPGHSCQVFASSAPRQMVGKPSWGVRTPWPWWTWWRFMLHHFASFCMELAKENMKNGRNSMQLGAKAPALNLEDIHTPEEELISAIPFLHFCGVLQSFCSPFELL